MSIEEFERREELVRLKAALDEAEREYQAGAPTYSLEEIDAMMEDILNSETRQTT